MIKKICEYCGKEFTCKPSENRKYCCKDCSNKASKNKPNLKNRSNKVKVICKVCGKVEYVTPSRAKKYVCCSKECMGKLNSQKYSQKIKCICPICGKEFYLKPFYYNRASTHCCSKECSAKLKETTFAKENNHQFGLKGELNSSFKGKEIPKRNIHQVDLMVYDPENPEANKSGRIKKHRQIIYQNKDRFDDCIFNDEILNKKIQVHHIDCNHNNN